MTTPSRLLLLMAIFGCVASATFGILIYQGRQQYSAQLVAVENSLKSVPNVRYEGNFRKATSEPAASIQRTQAVQQISQKETSQVLQDMQTKLNSTVTEKDKFALELNVAKKEAETAQKELGQARQQEQSVRNDLKVLQDALRGQTPQQILEKVRVLEASVESAKKEAADLKARLDAAQRASQASPMPALNQPVGKVTVVNKPWGFVVVDLGKKDNLTAGKELNVNHNNTFIGKVRVVSVDATTSTADIVPEWLKADIQVGDQVF